MHKIFVSMICLCLLLAKSYSQSIYTQIIHHGKVAFSSGTDTSLISVKEKTVKLLNRYVNEYYPKKKLPLIYFTIADRGKANNVQYQLSYDNLFGNSIEVNNTRRKGKYNKPGIKLQVNSVLFEEKSLLKLVDYGINNLREMKFLRRKAIKEGAGTGSALQLPPDKINNILLAPISDNIKNTLSK